MRLTELVFREVNVVLVHAGVLVPTISLDRVRAARPSSNMQVTSGPAGLTVLYPDERFLLQFDPQRITATDTSGRLPETSPVIEAALGQIPAIGSPTVVAFGFNVRFDFQVEGMDQPGAHLTRSIIHTPEAIAGALRADSFQAGVSFIYPRGVKLWTLRIDPMGPARLGVHANIHEDLRPPPPPPGESTGPPAPPWMPTGPLEQLGADVPGVESMKADLLLQARTAMDTVCALLSL